MVEVGKDLWISCSPNPSSKKGQLEQLVQDCVELVLNISDNKDSTTSLGNLFQGLITFTLKRVEFLVFQFVSNTYCPFTGHHSHIHVIMQVYHNIKSCGKHFAFCKPRSVGIWPSMSVAFYMLYKQAVFTSFSDWVRWLDTWKCYAFWNILVLLQNCLFTWVFVSWLK